MISTKINANTRCFLVWVKNVYYYRLLQAVAESKPEYLLHGKNAFFAI